MAVNALNQIKITLTGFNSSITVIDFVSMNPEEIINEQTAWLQQVNSGEIVVLNSFRALGYRLRLTAPKGHPRGQILRSDIQRYVDDSNAGGVTPKFTVDIETLDWYIHCEKGCSWERSVPNLNNDPEDTTYESFLLVLANVSLEAKTNLVG